MERGRGICVMSRRGCKARWALHLQVSASRWFGTTGDGAGALGEVRGRAHAVSLARRTCARRSRSFS